MNDDAFGITLLINAADLCKADPVCVGGVCILLPPGFTRIEDCSLTSNYWRVGVGVNEGGSQAFGSTEEEGVAGEGTGSAESGGRGLAESEQASKEGRALGSEDGGRVRAE